MKKMHKLECKPEQMHHKQTGNNFAFTVPSPDHLLSKNFSRTDVFFFYLYQGFIHLYIGHKGKAAFYQDLAKMLSSTCGPWTG